MNLGERRLLLSWLPPSSRNKAPRVRAEGKLRTTVALLGMVAGCSSSTPPSDPLADIQGRTGRLAAGAYYSCALTEDGALFCWGLGQGAGSIRKPVQVTDARDWVAVSAGQQTVHTCALRATGTIWCWGENEAGQIGDGTTTRRASPTQIGLDSDWAEVTVGNLHTCARKTNGTLFCWGRNFRGAVGEGPPTDQRTPIRVGVDADWVEVSARWYQTCARKANGTLWCWGAPRVDTIAEDRLAPVQVGTDTDWAQVSTSSEHVCARKTNGTLFCWGSNRFAALVTGSANSEALPKQVGTEADWREIANGGRTCARKRQGTLWCWGYLDFRSELVRTPTRIGVDSDWSEVDTSGGHTCARKTNGTLFCWGDNSAGQLGNGKVRAGSTTEMVQVELIP